MPKLDLHIVDALYTNGRRVSCAEMAGRSLLPAA
jgi:hypothetical protein